MRTSNSLSWLVVAVSAAMLLAVAAACSAETVEVPGETVVVEKVVTETVEVPGETVVVEKEVIKTVEVPGETVTKEVVKTVEVPGQTVVVEKEVVKTVEVPGQTVVVEKEVVKEIEGERYTRNVWGQVVEKPQYGGSIPVAIDSEIITWDPVEILRGQGASWTRHVIFEKLGDVDYSIPRDRFDFTALASIETTSGAIAESWEQTDPLTVTFNIRQGINWQNKGLPAGRELTAKDVELTFHRSMGLGSGFTEPGPFVNQVKALPVESVTATDDWTVEVKSSQFSFKTLEVLLFESSGGAMIVPPEVVKAHGNDSGAITDWKEIVGTGPFMVSDYREGATLTLAKNPDYWGFDAVHPSNRLPYADEIKMLIMPDIATKVAALRTGKITMLGGRGMPLDQVWSLQKTNPELVVTKVAGTSVNMSFNNSKPPFDNLDVRVAMQKALNVEEAARTYYKGFADPTPIGSSFPLPGQFTPFEDWPEEIKWKYEYDPEAAEKLLDDAGLTRDSDGIRFKTTMDVIDGWGADIDVMLLAREYWKRIGIDVEIVQIADGDFGWQKNQALDYDMAQCGCRGKMLDALSTLRGRFHSKKGWGNTANDPNVGSGSVYGVNDPAFDAIVDAAEVATTREELNAKIREMNLYYSDQVWALFFPPVVQAVRINQPWIKGYAGEAGALDEAWTQALNFVWIDRELRSDLGH